MSASSSRPALAPRAGNGRAMIWCVAGAWIVTLAAGPSEAATPAAAGPASKEGVEFFEKKIRPVLAKTCYTCHAGSIQARGGLRLDTRAGLEIGGQNGTIIDPKNPAESKLLAVLHDEGPEMPPAGPLPPETIEDFKVWVAMGAPFPREEEAK